MKEIIEKLLHHEINDFLDKNKPVIREIVKETLLPELRAVIREMIPSILKDVIRETSETEHELENKITYSQQTAEKIINRKEFSHQTIQSEVTSKITQNTAESAVEKIQPEINSTGKYIYCIAIGTENLNFGNIGINGNEVYTIFEKDLCAVVHDCPAIPYQSDDDAVVKQWVLEHQKVVDTAWEKFGVVIPIGFDTIITGNRGGDSEMNMKNWLANDYDNLMAKIDKISGKAEYGVQIFWDSAIMAQKAAEESHEIKTITEEIKSKPDGLAYMYRQKLEGLLKKEMENQANIYFKDFYKQIKFYTHDIHIEKTKKVDDESKQMLMNLSCLLPKQSTTGLGDTLEKIKTTEGFSVLYTGPWPPYSFV